MFLSTLFLVNGSLCAAAVMFAALARSGKREAMTLAALLSANFLFCALCWTEYSPKYALSDMGFDVSNKDLWFCADALFGMACIIAYDRWWGWALWFSSGVQLGIHMAYEAGALGPTAYSDRLQDVLLAQLAVFFFIGGAGAQALFLDFVARFRGYGRQAETARIAASEEAES